MPHEKMHRLKEVLRVLHDQAEELLDKHEVCEMLSRGWADEETPDGNYFGLAMWQINPPFKHDWATFMGGRLQRKIEDRVARSVMRGMSIAGQTL